MEWFDIHNTTEYEGPAVYEIRLVTEDGMACMLNRLLDTDKWGIIAIGKSINMESRLKTFVKAVEKGNSPHSEGLLLYRLKQSSRFNSVFSKTLLQYCFTKVNNENEAGDKEEEEMIKKYVKKYGEVPPLNSSIPKRYGENGW